MKKSFYIFLTSILGILLFVALQRIFVLFYSLLLGFNYPVFSFGFSFVGILALDYLTLFLALVLGAWYGIWLGLYWYDVVYERASFRGLVHHFVKNWWTGGGGSNRVVKSRLMNISEDLEKDSWQLDDLAKHIQVSKKTNSKGKLKG